MPKPKAKKPMRKKTIAKKEMKYRALWQGHISFGLINIPVSLISAQRKASRPHFHMIDKRNMSRIHYEKINEKNGKTVPLSEIVKGYEFDKDNYIVLTEQEIKKAAPENTQSIMIEDFVLKKELPPIYYESPYYLLPAKGAEKGYVLLTQTLMESDKIGIATIVMHGRQHLTALLPYEHGLVLNFLRFEDELQTANDFFDFHLNKNITTKEKQIAKQLVDTLTVKWNPKKYHDDFNEILQKIIKNKIKTGKVTEIPSEKSELPSTSNVVDFMSLMKKSIEISEKKHKKAS